MVKSSSSCYEEQVGLKKGPWTQEEDQKLMSYIQLHGAQGIWSSLPLKAGLRRCGKSCRLRWNNYLRPDIKRGNFSSQEDQTIIQLHALLGNRWSVIAQQLPKRTDNEVKNHWNTNLKKKLTKMGINPTTHKPFNDTSKLSHVAQWETTRLEAEARQAKEHCKVKNQLGTSSSSSLPSLTRLVLKKVTPRAPPPPCLDVLKVCHNSRSSSMSTDPNTLNMHSMYAMMLTADDLESPASTLTFPSTISTTNSKCTNNKNNNGTFGLINYQNSLPSSSSMANDDRILMKGETVCENNVGSLVEDDNIMVAMEAFTSSKGHNCNSMEDLRDDEDVFVYGDEDWESILDLVNASPPVFPAL